MHLHVALMLAGLSACATGPVLMSPALIPPPPFFLDDSAGVVRRVQEVFACAEASHELPIGTLGWRRGSDHVDVTLMQGIAPSVAPPGPDRMCYKGFRVEADGSILALPERDWPYTILRKRAPATPRL